MQKYLSVIVGVVSGLIISFGAITIESEQVAHGSDENGASLWNKFIASSEALDWGDIFDTEANGFFGAYNMIRDKLSDRAERETLTQVSAVYGLTTEEAKSVLNGATSPILNNPEFKGKITQEKAAAMINNFIEDYRTMESVMQIQQEIDAEISPSEIFANGDLDDSGFDLIEDLSNIERVLFGEASETSIGGPYAGALDSPIPDGYVPPGAENLFTGAVEDDPLYDSIEGAVVVDNDDDEVIDFGDGEGTSVEVRKEDVCPADNPYADAASESEEDEGEGEADSGGDEDGDGDDDAEDDGGEDDEGRPVAATGGDWAEEFCPGGIGGEGAVSAGADAGADFSQFKSIGGSAVLGGIVGALTGSEGGTGASAGVEIPGFSANVSVCLTIETIKGSVSSDVSSDNSCIQCEIEMINGFLEETLSHTQVPNKATGNIMESGKCKDSGSPVSLNFVTIWQPVPTPPNNDLIEGKNVFAEWNDFANKYMPYLGATFDNPDEPHLSSDMQTQVAINNSSPGASALSIIAEVESIKGQYTAEALAEVESADLNHRATDGLLYTVNVLREMEQMNNYLRAFNNTYQNIIDGPLKMLKVKPDQS